jgi:hypothetical protein
VGEVAAPLGSCAGNRGLEVAAWPREEEGGEKEGKKKKGDKKRKKRKREIEKRK